MSIIFSLWIVTFINREWHFIFYWVFYAWNKYFVEHNTATSMGLFDTWLKKIFIHSFIHSCHFPLLFCFMSIYCGQHIREFEFVAQLEDILMEQLKILHLFQYRFICFFVCHCFTLSILSFLEFYLFSISSYAECFISFYILQWLSRHIYFIGCYWLPLSTRNN